MGVALPRTREQMHARVAKIQANTRHQTAAKVRRTTLRAWQAYEAANQRANREYERTRLP